MASAPVPKPCATACPPTGLHCSQTVQSIPSIKTRHRHPFVALTSRPTPLTSRIGTLVNSDLAALPTIGPRGHRPLPTTHGYSKPNRISYICCLQQCRRPRPITRKKQHRLPAMSPTRSTTVISRTYSLPSRVISPMYLRSLSPDTVVCFASSVFFVCL